MNFLVRAIQDDGISVNKKAAILRFATILPSSGSKTQIAQAARKLIKMDFKDNRESGIRLMSNLLDLYRVTDPKSFVTDALDILDIYKDEDIIAQQVSRMLDRMEPSAAARLITKLGSRSDAISKFYITMFALRTSSESKLDKVWLDSTIEKSLQFSFGDRSNPTVSDFLSTTALIAPDNKHFWDLVASFAKAARAKGFSLEYHISRDFDDDQKPYLALQGKGTSFGFQTRPYSQLLPRISREFLRRSNVLDKPNSDDLSVMEFWMLRHARTDSASEDESSLPSYKAYFLYQAKNEIKDGNNLIVAKDRVADKIAIGIEQKAPGDLAIKIYWRDPIGTLQNSTVSRLQGLERNKITLRTGVPSISLDDDL